MLLACSLSLRRGLLHTVFCLPEGELFFSGASLFTVHSRFCLAGGSLEKIIYCGSFALIVE